MNFERNLDKYAELSIKVGMNVQPGETLLVRSPIDCADFVRKAVKYAYECGAKHKSWNESSARRNSFSSLTYRLR